MTVQDVTSAMPEAFNVAARALMAWDMSRAEAASVLGLTQDQWDQYVDGLPASGVSTDLVQRTSLLLGIEKALEILLSGERAQAEIDIARWVGSPSDAPLFSGQSPKSLMVSGHLAHLVEIRRYLDGWLGGDFG